MNQELFNFTLDDELSLDVAPFTFDNDKMTGFDLEVLLPKILNLKIAQ